MLRLVVHQNLRSSSVAQSRRDISAIDRDAITWCELRAGLSNAVIQSDATFLHPALDFAARSQSVLRKNLVKTFGHGISALME
jgi:hypothetical protein